MAADVIRERVRRVKAGTNRLFAINYLLALDPLTLPIALGSWSARRSIRNVAFLGRMPSRRSGRRTRRWASSSRPSTALAARWTGGWII
jgi:hypothetical protein